MKRMVIVFMALCVIGLSGCITTSATSGTGGGDVTVSSNTEGATVDVGVSVNLNFRNWYPWGGVQAAPNGNTVTLNGKVNVGGYVSEQLPQDLKGKTVTLEIPNAAASNFSDERLMKITVNKGDRVIRPRNVPDLIEKEYIPSDYKSVNFTLPDDFDGKLGFVFYQADLKGLQITATYR